MVWKKREFAEILQYFVHFACLTGLDYWVNTNNLS